MTILIRDMRQRERTIDRVWNPVVPHFLSYVYGGTLYGRTYTAVPVDINDPLTGQSSMPYGFYFAPPPVPPLVPIQGNVSLSTLFSTTPLTTTTPGTITTTQPITTTTPVTAANILHEGDGEVECGLQSTPLMATSFGVQDVTILADDSNLGTIWVSGQFQQPAGAGFPLKAGASIGKGVLGSGKLVDLSTVFIIGTDAADKVYIEYEY